MGSKQCEPCRGAVRFLPRATGLINTTVTVADLLAHTNYTFEIEAQNGVSSLAPALRQYAAVTITTNQAGEAVSTTLPPQAKPVNKNQQIVKDPVIVPTYSEWSCISAV